MDNLEKIEKINNNLIEVRKKYELEIEELIELEIRNICDIFNSDNENFAKMYNVSGMGGCTFYLKFLDNDYKSINIAENMEDFYKQINHIKKNMKDYCEDLEITNYKNINLSNKFKNAYTKLLKTIENISNKNYCFFNLEDSNFDTRIPSYFKSLNNDFECNVNDNKFLTILAASNINWQFRIPNFFNNLSKTGLLKDEVNFYLNLDHDKIVEINKELILKSNLFNNIDYKDKNINNILKIDYNSNFNDIILKLKEIFKINDYSKLLKFLNTITTNEKLEKIFNKNEKIKFLNDLGYYYFDKNNLNNEQNLLENIKTLLNKDELILVERLNEINPNEIVKYIKDNSIATITITNLINNQKFEMDFNNFVNIDNEFNIER